MLAKIRAYLKEKQLIERLYLKEPITVEFLAQGEYNQNFLISDGEVSYVFRLNYGSQLHLANQISYEYHGLKWLERTGRTPRVYYLDDHRDFFSQGLLIMEFLPGQPLNYRKDLSEAARIFGQIHQQPIDERAARIFVKEKETILSDRVTECQQLLEPVLKSDVVPLQAKKQLAAALVWCQNNTAQQQFFIDLDQWSITNTEVNSHNFIIGEKGFLIDWEKPVISHPVQDLSQFLASTTTLWRSNLILDQSEKRDFLTRYIAETQFERQSMEEALKIYHPFLMLRALAWSAMAYDSYQKETKKLTNQEIFKKVTAYLEEDFLRQALKEQVIE
ncbi:aminoglycoside phosphotransferase family protein [Enterococcus xiangfangensis]|uniref:aminoglycoside phosphotransferase family protein n=1 Tax=Enterococcus xiangfangensis TaxID=1296537 RepID=UPI0010F70AA7|nr:aminoglycoside phosphotransferase family protein [Enterococcus xiangfangensis]MBM7711582.1 aminoglycoside phosphotransferase (APT) family kinase protein [Enterococcus xiangfangensis]